MPAPIAILKTLGLIKSNWKLFGVIALVVASGSVHVFQYMRITGLEKNVVKLEEDKDKIINEREFYKIELARCKANFVELKEEIEEQQRISEEDKNKIDQLAEVIEQLESENDELIQKIWESEAPTSCEDGVRILLDAVGEFKWHGKESAIELVESRQLE